MRPVESCIKRKATRSFFFIENASIKRKERYGNGEIETNAGYVKKNHNPTRYFALEGSVRTGRRITRGRVALTRCGDGAE